MNGTKPSAVISAHELSKCYHVYRRPLDLAWELLTGNQRHRQFWALNNVSFELTAGEVVGVVGRNGAGKSTLLRILAGTLAQTSGTVAVHGKVSAILELGTGFHDERTGRENVLLGGMCLGMSRDEVRRKFDAIVAFTELESFIDQPLKTYSAGMRARLAFATAISVEPDVFIIDEALATGDAGFVAKCLERIHKICSSGATVLFVSHSTDMIKRLCNRVLVIDQGNLMIDAGPLEACGQYESMLLRGASEANQRRSAASGTKHGGDLLDILDVTPLGDGGVPNYAFFQHDPLNIAVSIDCRTAVRNPGVYLRFTRTDGIIATSWFSHEPDKQDIGILPPGRHTLSVSADDLLLGDGSYELLVALYPEKSGGNTALYVDPYCLWSGVARLEVKRRSRSLSTFFDQPMRLALQDPPHDSGPEHQPAP